MIAGTTYQIRAPSESELLNLHTQVVCGQLWGRQRRRAAHIVSCFIAMFGPNSVQSSWANPQQNQQQTQGSAFGQPGAFGSGGKTSHLQPCSFRTFKPPSTAFGSTNAFGQQQQPAANPMFGNLGTSNTGTSAFGLFAFPYILRDSGSHTTINC